jgi:CheY-like chemotaxis protein
MEDKVRQLQEIAPSFVDPPDEIEVEVCAKFSQAAKRLRTQRYDVLILDLKDESDPTLEAEAHPAGLEIFSELKQTRFVPVVFYTALAHKVRSEETSFVRVVEKTEDVTKVRDEVRRVLGTGLPSLTRRLEEVQRSYMWDFVSVHWKDFPQLADQADIAYLLARRLAITLQATAGELAAKVGGAGEAPVSAAKSHPMIMYVVPSIGPHPRAGDIISEEVQGQTVHWLILTPSCDFAQKKADHFTMVKCERLADRDEFKKWAAAKDDKTKDKVEQLIMDQRGDRYKFLPGSFFLPDLVADFQQLRTVDIASMAKFAPIVTVDSPFAESIVAKFSRYFNRLGTPDIDKTVVMNRLQARIPPK